MKLASLIALSHLALGAINSTFAEHKKELNKNMTQSSDHTFSLSLQRIYQPLGFQNNQNINSETDEELPTIPFQNNNPTNSSGENRNGHYQNLLTISQLLPSSRTSQETTPDPNRNYGISLDSGAQYIEVLESDRIYIS